MYCNVMTNGTALLSKYKITKQLCWSFLSHHFVRLTLDGRLDWCCLVPAVNWRKTYRFLPSLLTDWDCSGWPEQYCRWQCQSKVWITPKPDWQDPQIIPRSQKYHPMQPCSVRRACRPLGLALGSLAAPHVGKSIEFTWIKLSVRPPQAQLRQLSIF